MASRFETLKPSDLEWNGVLYKVHKNLPVGSKVNMKKTVHVDIMLSSSWLRKGKEDVNIFFLKSSFNILMLAQATELHKTTSDRGGGTLMDPLPVKRLIRHNNFSYVFIF
jgi:hypothetical protein